MVKEENLFQLHQQCFEKSGPVTQVKEFPLTVLEDLGYLKSMRPVVKDRMGVT